MPSNNTSSPLVSAAINNDHNHLNQSHAQKVVMTGVGDGAQASGASVGEASRGMLYFIVIAGLSMIFFSIFAVWCVR